MPSVLDKVLRRLGDRPAKLAFAASNAQPFKDMLGSRYTAALQAYSPMLPALNPTDRDIVAALQRDGVYRTSLAALGLAGSAEMLQSAQQVAESCAVTARTAAASGRDFTCAPADSIIENAAIFNWGLSDRLLDIAEAYLGLPVAYDGLNLIYTVADGREVATRQWHRDREDRKMLKVAVYCNNVGEGGGPLQVITRLDGTQNDENGYRYTGGEEEELSSLLGADYRDDIVTCTGDAGTVVFVDTARYFHRGEPVHTEDRKALYFSYFAQQTRHPYFCERSGLKRAQLAHMAEGLPARQRSSVLWQKAQPWWAKLVPPAPV